MYNSGSLHIFLDKVLDDVLFKSSIPQIYHYTDLNAAISILNTGVLRITDTAFLNDKSEVIDSIGILLEELDRSNIASELAGAIRSSTNSGLPRTYVMSFSTSRDDLGQWRAYGSDGTGVCLGFDPKSVTPENILHRAFLSKVAYSEPEKRELFRRYFSEIGHVYRNASNVDRIDIERAAILYLPVILGLCKNSNFSGEGEVRLIHVDAFNLGKPSRWVPRFLSRGRLKFREKAGVLIPYMETTNSLPYHEESAAWIWAQIGLIPTIETISFGPRANYEMGRISLEMMLNRAGLKNISIERSGIPYRG